MSTQILSSIIMPAYNAAQYIRQAIESVLAQTYENWQLIIVDDGSTDDTLTIARSYADADKKGRIIVVHQENSGTAAAARNTALSYVTGEYIQMLDSDDYLSSDYLESVNRCLQQAPEGERPEVVIGVAKLVREDGTVIWEKPDESLLGKTISGEQAFALSIDWNIHGCMYVCSTLMKKIKYDASLINGDEFTTRKVFANINRLTVVEGIYYYRYNEGSTTKSAKNSARMYECLMTDGNIYNYAVERKMPQEIVYRCKRKWFRNIVAREVLYLREKDMYSKEERKFIQDIIEGELKKTAFVEKNGGGVLSIIMVFTAGRIYRLKFLAQIYNLLRNAKQKSHRFS